MYMFLRKGPLLCLKFLRVHDCSFPSRRMLYGRTTSYLCPL